MVSLLYLYGRLYLKYISIQSEDTVVFPLECAKIVNYFGHFTGSVFCLGDRLFC